jgi:hypothetical protein
MVPAWAVGFVLYETLSSLGFDVVAHSPVDIAATLRSVFLIVIFGPIIETLILTWTVTVAMSANVSRRKIALVSGLVWGVLHGFYGILAFIPTAWGFFVFTSANLAWRSTSLKSSMYAAWFPHAVNNAVAMAIIFWMAQTLPSK